MVGLHDRALVGELEEHRRKLVFPLVAIYVLVRDLGGDVAGDDEHSLDLFVFGDSPCNPGRKSDPYQHGASASDRERVPPEVRTPALARAPSRTATRAQDLP
jgi:hypothetical protein